MDIQTQYCWLALTHMTGLGARAKIALLEGLGSPEVIFAASRSTLKDILAEQDLAVVDANALGSIVDGVGVESFTPSQQWLAQDGHHLITWTDVDYPPLLREI